MADEYYKGVKLLKGKTPRKNYFQEKFVNQYKNGLLSYDDAHEKMVATGTSKVTATKKLNAEK